MSAQFQKEVKAAQLREDIRRLEAELIQKKQALAALDGKKYIQLETIRIDARPRDLPSPRSRRDSGDRLPDWCVMNDPSHPRHKERLRAKNRFK